jgi:hypothetical protein
MRSFHHAGVITDEKQPGESYVAATKVWVTDPLQHPYRIEYLRFEPDSPVSGPVRDLPHFAYRVADLDAEIAGKDVLLGPFEAMPGLRVVFVQVDGGVLEFMEFAEEAGDWGRQPGAAGTEE